MADPFSIALGALQVAGTGFQAATTLLSYSDAVRKAKGDVKNLATEVSMMATVLQELGLTLQSSRTERLCRVSALKAAKDGLTVVMLRLKRSRVRWKSFEVERGEWH